MKKLILIASVLFSSSIFAANVPWNDIEMYERYTLTQDIVFENGLTFKKGEVFEVTDFGMGGVPVAYYDMHAMNCKNPEQTAEMSILEVNEDPTKTTRIGVQLSEGCTLEVFVDLYDYYTVAPFAN